MRGIGRSRNDIPQPEVESVLRSERRGFLETFHRTILTCIHVERPIVRSHSATVVEPLTREGAFTWLWVKWGGMVSSNIPAILLKKLRQRNFFFRHSMLSVYLLDRAPRVVSGSCPSRAQRSACGRPFTTIIRGTRAVFFSILIIILSQGCVSTTIDGPSPEAPIERLAALAPNTINLIVEGSETPLPLGHQYLFVAIPFGTIALRSPLDALAESVHREFAIAGIRAFRGGTDPTRPTLTLRFTELHTSAYDLIVIRRVSAAARLSAQLTLPDSKLSLETSGESSSFERFGFKPQLEAALAEALALASRQLAITLQTTPAFRYPRRRVSPM